MNIMSIWTLIFFLSLNLNRLFIDYFMLNSWLFRIFKSSLLDIRMYIWFRLGCLKNMRYWLPWLNRRMIVERLIDNHDILRLAVREFKLGRSKNYLICWSRNRTIRIKEMSRMNTLMLMNGSLVLILNW